MEQDIRFCSAPDGARIAYATVGSGPPLVWSANIYSHLELDWAEPGWRQFYEALARRHRLVRYDRVGAGLSDRERSDFSLTYEVATLVAVVDALALDRFALVGNSQGAKTPIGFAAEQPQRLTHLVLFGSNAAFPYPREVIEPMLALIRANWYLGARMLADGMMPDADGAARERFAALSQVSVSGEMMARYVEWDADHSVVALCQRVQVPTLVLHRREDRTVPFAAGRELAALIPGARLVTLSGQAHLPYLDDAEALLQAVAAFVDDVRGAPLNLAFEQRARSSTPAAVSGLSEREVEVLRLLAAGKTNREIAAVLVVSPNTVAFHVKGIFNKTGVANRTEAAAYAHRHGLAGSSA